MARVTNSQTLTALATDQFNLATLIKMELETTAYITDYGQNITYNTQTYDASSYILSVGDASETGGIKVNSMSLELSAVGGTYVSLFLNSDNTNKKVIIQRAVIDDDGDVVGDPIDYFTGRITSVEIDDSGTDSVISVEFASHWKDFEKIQNRKTNPASQNFWFPDDKGFRFSASAVTTLKWGRK